MVNSSPLRDDDRLGSGLRIRPELGICHPRRTADALAVVFDNDVRGRSFSGLTVVLVFSPVEEFPLEGTGILQGAPHFGQTVRILQLATPGVLCPQGSAERVQL